MDKDELKEFVSNHSSNGVCYIEFNYKELGKDEHWFNNNCIILQHDMENAYKSEYDRAKEDILDSINSNHITTDDCKYYNSDAVLKLLEKLYIKMYSMIRIILNYKLNIKRNDVIL